MRFLVRLKPKGERRPAFLPLVRSLAVAVMTEARNPKWTSYGALEVDIFAPSVGDFELFLAAVGPLAEVEFSRNLNESPPYKTKVELVAEARGFFNAERYWEAHEDLESVWRTSAGAEKSYLQGIILVCAAFVHFQKREPGVALGVLRRAEKQLTYRADSYHGIKVGALKEHVDAILGSGKFETFRL